MCAAKPCDRPVGDKGARGYCSKHYKRLRSRGDVDYAFQAPVEVRFARKFTKGGPDECWEWQAGKDADGYGSISIGHSGAVRAHRFAWELATGKPIPGGMLVCHVCDNPPCVNPAHLFLGSITDNNRDKLTKGRHRGNSSGTLGDFRRRLTAEQVDAIRAFGKPYYGAMADLAREYGVSGEHIRRIQDGTRRQG